MKKKIGSIIEIHPLTLNIENIFNLPTDIKVIPKGESENDINEE
jgi:hypothetical protein